MTKLKELFNSKGYAIQRVLLVGLAFVLGFIVLFTISIEVWEYSNSPDFCTNVCHDVHPEEQIAYQDSYHANVRCTECHLSRGGLLENLPLKAGHLQHLPETLLGQYGRPVEWRTLRPASESCERCHWPPAFQGDVVREIRRFLPDENNTEKRTYLILKIGGGKKDELDTGMGYGIHWHALNRVEYIASDERRQDIRWVRATFPDGRVVEYNDATNPLPAEEIATAEKRVMDCVDCHNRVGHPFPSPEQAIDDALAQGKLSRDLPFIKREMLALLTPNYPSREEAVVAIESWEAQYKTKYPEVATSHAAEIDQAAEVAKELLTRLVFEEEGITWQSFIDNNGHKDFPGCFRCHDGKHLSPEGESIRLHCNICHSVPVTVDPGGNPPQVPAAALQEPASHLEANFMADHRFQANDECSVCHGEIAFGDDDSSFCALSACHGQAWPLVDLDATFSHPIALEGKHTQVWCHDCHEGVKKPEYKCANCHEPSIQPHFGTECEDCHTPIGWEQVELTDFEHPVALEGSHATLDCLTCHTAGKKLIYECATCHQPPDDHLEGTCDTCHTPEGWSTSVASLVAQSPQISHTLDGRDDCLMCHDPAGQIKPAPADHTGFTNVQCVLCHKVAP